MVGGSATTVGSSTSGRGSSGSQGAVLKVVRTLRRMHFRRSGGRMGTTLRGDPVSLLATTGRKLGHDESARPLCHLRAGDEPLASGGGTMRHPAGYLKPRANPRVGVQVGRGPLRWSPGTRRGPSDRGCGSASFGAHRGESYVYTRVTPNSRKGASGGSQPRTNTAQDAGACLAMESPSSAVA